MKFFVVASRTVWKDGPQKVIALYTKAAALLRLLFSSNMGPVKSYVNPGRLLS